MSSAGLTLRPGMVHSVLTTSSVPTGFDLPLGLYACLEELLESSSSMSSGLSHPRWVSASAAAPLEAPRETERTSEDWHDIVGALGGDAGSYARLVERYQSQVMTHLWRFSRERATCEELVQEVFVQAYLSLGTYRGKAPLLHWLRKIATRVGYRHWKQEGRRRATVRLSDEQWERVARPVPEELSADEAGALVHQVLQVLRPRDRLVLTLMYLEGCSVAEVAALSGWSQTMVKVQAFRARKKLKKLLEAANP